MNIWRSALNQWVANFSPRSAIHDERFDLTWLKVQQTLEELSRLKVDWNLPITIGGHRNAQTVLSILWTLVNGGVGLTLEKSVIASTLEHVHQQLPSHYLLLHEADLDRFRDLLRQLSYDITNPLILHPLGPDEILGPPILLKSLAHRKVDMPADCGWMLMTSGTTAAPKLVMLEKNDLAERARLEIREFSITPDDELLNVLPVSHDVGFNQILAWILSGARLTVQSSSSSSKMETNLTEQNISGVSGTPLMWSSFLRNAKEGKVYSRVRYLTISGGILEKASRLKLGTLFPNASVFRTYGQTETFRSLIQKDNLEMDTHGQSPAGVQTVLLDSNDQLVSAGTEGELVHSGIGTMLGYFPNPNSAKSVRTGDFFIRTGDGQFRFVGRRDDLIKRWEVRMHLSEVEDVIMKMDDVAQVCVLNRPCSDHRENELAAFVISKKIATASELVEAVKRHCELSLAASKIPDFVFIIDELPKTASQKIDRKALRNLWETKNA